MAKAEKQIAVQIIFNSPRGTQEALYTNAVNLKPDQALALFLSHGSNFGDKQETLVEVKYDEI